MKDPLDIDMEACRKVGEIYGEMHISAKDLVERVAVGVITLATIGGVVSVFALLFGCCRG